MSGLDENGEKVHAAMYNDLWTNGPFEINEFPDYTLLEHFKRPYPSHPPRSVCLDYMEGVYSHYIPILRTLNNHKQCHKNHNFTSYFVNKNVLIEQ